MAGYTRNNSNIATGNVIQASDLNGEFNDVVSAFNATSGHTHDGTSAEGAPITKVGPAQNITVNATNITPSVHNTVDVGTTSLRYKDAYFQGSVNTAGSFVGAVTGNASTATALATARSIAGQSFDGSADITIAPTDLTGVTATATELNLLDGVTATTAEINYLDGVTSSIQTQIDSISSSGGTTLSSLGVTATASELNIMDGVTATTAELNIMDGVTSTAAELNILDGVTSTATELNILDGVTASTAELNILDGVTATATELNILDGVTATTAELNYVDGVTSSIQTQLDAKQATLTSTSNGYGTRTVSTSDPSGGSNGDIWYKVSS